MTRAAKPERRGRAVSQKAARRLAEAIMRLAEPAVGTKGRTAIVQVLCSLEPEEVRLLALRYCDELDESEIADMLGIATPRTVKRRLRRLRRTVRERLGIGEEDEFDREFVADTFGPMPPEAKAKWERAKRKRGRPKVGKGVKVISVSVEKDLLAKSDAMARRLGIPRATLIARGLRRVLAEVDKP